MNTKGCKLTTPSGVSSVDISAFLASFHKGFKDLASKQAVAAVADSLPAAATDASVADAAPKAPPKRKTPAIVKPKPNRHAALSQGSIDRVKRLGASLFNPKELSKAELAVWNLIQDTNTLTQDICSCDLPSDEARDAVLVKVTQDKADGILAAKDKTWLRKIIEIALLSKQDGFGNCQEKAFFAFATLLYEAQKPMSLITSLRLATFNNHFILIVNDQFLMDPWLNFAFPLKKGSIDYVFSGFGPLVDYFSINARGQCFTHAVRVGYDTQRDPHSEEDMAACLKLIQAKPAVLSIDDQEESLGTGAEKPAKRSKKAESAETAAESSPPVAESAVVQQQAPLSAFFLPAMPSAAPTAEPFSFHFS